MFWKKWFNQAGETAPQKSKLRPPGDLPQQIGQYLVVKLGKDPDWVWSLKAALKPVDGGKKSERLYRIFDPMTAKSRGIVVQNFDTLDVNFDLIICEGRYDKDSHQVEMQFREVPNAA